MLDKCFCERLFERNPIAHGPVILLTVFNRSLSKLCSTIFFRCRYLSSEREAMLSVHDEMSTMPEGINNINIIIIIYYYYYCKPCLSHSVAFSVYIVKICGKICI